MESKIEANPLALYQGALEKGIDPEKLGRLLDLAENWNSQRAREAYAAALCDCQGEMPKILRDAKNEQTRSRYATLEAVNRRLVPVYTSHGFSLSFGTADSSLPEHMRIVCDVRHRAGHSERYFLDLPLDGKGLKGNDNKTPTHAAGSTMSYGRRYLEMLIFNLTMTNEDDDGNGGSELVGPATLAELEEMLAQTGREPASFLKWASTRLNRPIARLEDVTEACAQHALNMLKQKG